MKILKTLEIKIDPEYTGLNDYYSGTEGGCMLYKIFIKQGYDMTIKNNYIGASFIRLNGILYSIINASFINYLTKNKQDRFQSIDFVEFEEKKTIK